MKSVPASVVGVYINTGIWLAQNFFVYFKDPLLYPKLCIFFLFSLTYQMYNTDLHYPNCQFFSPFLCKSSVTVMIKHVLTCLNSFISYVNRK